MAIVQPDYAAGFHDGFVDYVYAGGSGEPPPVPPRIFWNASLRTAEGKLRANQWFDGYREGARIAREAGYRDMAIVSSSIAVQSYAQPACRQTSEGLDANPSASPENVEELPEAPAPFQKSQTSDDLLGNPFRSPKNVEALPEAVAPLQKDAAVDSKMPNPLPAELPLPANDPSEGQERASDTSTVVPERASPDTVPAITTPAATEPKSAPEAAGPTSATPAMEPESEAAFVEPSAWDEASCGRPEPINHVAVPPKLNTEQQSKSRGEEPIKPGRLTINAGVASDVAGSTVSLVGESTHGIGGSRTNASMPAVSPVKSIEQETKCPASASKCTSASPTDSAAAQKATESPVVKQGDDTPSPMLTPRTQAAKAFLFGF